MFMWGVHWLICMGNVTAPVTLILHLRFCRNIILFLDSRLTAYTQNELFEEVLLLFLDMEMEGVRPNEFT